MENEKHTGAALPADKPTDLAYELVTLTKNAENEIGPTECRRALNVFLWEMVSQGLVNREMLIDAWTAITVTFATNGGE